MSTLRQLQERLRERAEHHLRMSAMAEMRRRHPQGTTEPYHERGGLLWRHAFVPLYHRVPWHVRAQAMRTLRMTAHSSGWTAPPRRWSEPWQPPRPPSASSASSELPAPTAR